MRYFDDAVPLRPYNKEQMTNDKGQRTKDKGQRTKDIHLLLTSVTRQFNFKFSQKFQKVTMPIAIKLAR
uniref:Uncharacterized protein n=1 Tax=Planktothricoides sp. SpSt-374 TaxID=2282167 RepID=A0A7C3ZHS1_9CYAN